MKYFFEAKSVCIFEHKPSQKTSKLIETRFGLDVSENLQRSMYLDEHNLPTADGARWLSIALVMALVGNIHAAHKKGYWKDFEHMAFVIEELQRGFVEQFEVGKSSFLAPLP